MDNINENMGQVNPAEKTLHTMTPAVEPAVADVEVKAPVQKNYARKYTKGSKMVLLSLRIPENCKQRIKLLADNHFRGNMTETILKAVNDLQGAKECECLEDTECFCDNCTPEKKDGEES